MRDEEGIAEIIALVDEAGQKKHKGPVALSHKAADILARHPGVWRAVSDLNVQAVENIAMAHTSGAADQVAAVIVSWNSIIAELSPADITPVERLLVEQVATAWVDYHFVSGKHSAHTKGQHNVTTGAYWDKRLNAAQRRYLRAVETLARVRKIERTQPLQINIAEQQVVANKFA